MGSNRPYTAAELSIIREVIARKDFSHFAQYVVPSLQMTPFHQMYYDVLNKFAHGEIRKLIVSIPPQHGKSVGSSQLLPAYMLGLNPDLKIAIASYAFSLATKFNKRVQRIIRDDNYRRVFPLTGLKDTSRQKDAGSYVQTSEEFEIVGRLGSLRAVGREGSITGNPVDIAIIDDLYKDAMEGNSSTVRDAAWEWYISAMKTRLHNNSQELIVFTRWHEDDLIGRLESKETVVELASLSQIDATFDGWYKLNFEAIKESDPTQIDPRQPGEPLWSERHGLKLLNEKRALDRLKFDCMYQGRPFSKEGLLYGDNFRTYTSIPTEITKLGNYTDTADTGTDYLCSVCYNVGKDGYIYVTDILFTQQHMEVTEPATAQMLNRNTTRVAYVESNNGGRGFARAVQKQCSLTRIEWFHQSGNKESRILTNSSTVLQKIIMPADWKIRWSEFYYSVTAYKRLFRANKSDDAADVLTGIVEVEILNTNKKIRAIGFSHKN